MRKMIRIDLSADKADTVSKAKTSVRRCETRVCFQVGGFRDEIDGNYLYFLAFRFNLASSFKSYSKSFSQTSVKS